MCVPQLRGSRAAGGAAFPLGGMGSNSASWVCLSASEPQRLRPSAGGLGPMRRQLQPVVPPGVRGHLPRDGREGGLHLRQLRREGLPVPQVRAPAEPPGLSGERRSFPRGPQGLFGEPGCKWCYSYPHGIIFQNSNPFLTLLYSPFDLCGCGGLPRWLLEPGGVSAAPEGSAVAVQLSWCSSGMCGASDPAWHTEPTARAVPRSPLSSVIDSSETFRFWVFVFFWVFVPPFSLPHFVFGRFRFIYLSNNFYVWFQRLEWQLGTACCFSGGAVQEAGGGCWRG